MGESDKVFYGNMCFICRLTSKEKRLKECRSCKLVLYCSEAHQKMHWKHHGSLCKIIKKIDLALKPENVDNNLNWYKYRTNLLTLSELKVGRKLKPYEINMILFPNNCQICHKKSDLQPCLDCLYVNYCSEDHKQADLASHKDICHVFALCIELDLHLEKSQFYPNYSLWEGNFSLLDSIDKFIEINVNIEKTRDITSKQERALVSEFLTCPLSLLFALVQIKYLFWENLVLHVVGCNTLETASLKSWETILHIKPNIQNLVIHFIGPEVHENNDVDLCPTCEDKLTMKFIPHFYHEYLNKSWFEKPDVICSFNCGFHEYENSEMDTWDKTLPLLVQNKEVPLVFTSFTKSEAEKDLELLIKINKNLNLKIVKNKFSSLRPFRDLENLGVYFNNAYIGLVWSDP